MSKSVFITRDLAADSPLYQLDENYRIRGCSLLRFKTITVDQWPTYDWLFFYSQQGVIHFCKQAVASENAKIAAFGPRTGLKCHTEGMTVDFTGNGKAIPTAQGLGMVARNQKILGPESTVCEAIVYANVPMEEVEISYADLLIFTSPLNVKSYFRRYSIEENQEVIAIGQTTAAALAEFGVSQVRIPKEASEESIVKLINSLNS